MMHGAIRGWAHLGIRGKIILSALMPLLITGLAILSDTSRATSMDIKAPGSRLVLLHTGATPTFGGSTLQALDPAAILDPARLNVPRVDLQRGQGHLGNILEGQADGDLTGRVTLQQFNTHELHRTSGGIVVSAGLRHQGKILIHSYTYSLLLRVGLGVGRLGRLLGFGLFDRLHRCGRIRRRCFRLGGLAPA